MHNGVDIIKHNVHRCHSTMIEAVKITNPYCKSSLMIDVRSRRCKLNYPLLPLLAVLSIFGNVFYLVANLQKDSIAQFAAPTGRQLVYDSPLPLTGEEIEAVENVTTLNETLETAAEQIMSVEVQEKKKRRRKGPKKANTRAPSLASNANFSACLLIKDDNDILSEWIAYHYHTLKLRRLVVAVDPLSAESPADILQRWRLMTDLQVFLWTDDQYMPKNFLEKGRPPVQHILRNGSSAFGGMSAEGLLQISSHRYRQRVFLAQCLKKFKAMESTWTMHIDTDEYVVPSKLFREKVTITTTDYVKTEPIETPASVLHLLQRAARKNPALINYPCVSMMRLLFGSVVDSSSSNSSNSSGGTAATVPEGFNSTAFESLRWRYHAPETNMSYHGSPKVIIDVSAIPAKGFHDDLVFSIHRPMRKYCPTSSDLDYTDYHKQPIAVNHYLGSYERYSGKSDNRRSRAIYDNKALVNAGTDDGMQLWLRGFVTDMGKESATKLLGKQYLVVTNNEALAVSVVAAAAVPESLSSVRRG